MLTKQEQIYNTLHGQPTAPADTTDSYDSFVSFLTNKYDPQLIDREVETTVMKNRALTLLFDEDDFYTHEELK